jgi:outer membrane murein-binding lipoprotein Lpp
VARTRSRNCSGVSGGTSVGDPGAGFGFTTAGAAASAAFLALRAASCAQIENLRRISELLRAQLDDVRADRDAWRDQAQAAQRLLSFEKASGPPDRWPWWRRIVA